MQGRLDVFQRHKLSKTPTGLQGFSYCNVTDFLKSLRLMQPFSYSQRHRLIILPQVDARVEPRGDRFTSPLKRTTKPPPHANSSLLPTFRHCLGEIRRNAPRAPCCMLQHESTESDDSFRPPDKRGASLLPRGSPSTLACLLDQGKGNIGVKNRKGTTHPLSPTAGGGGGGKRWTQT